MLHLATNHISWFFQGQVLKTVRTFCPFVAGVPNRQGVIVIAVGLRSGSQLAARFPGVEARLSLSHRLTMARSAAGPRHMPR
ncbi:hypothetical protein GDO78_021455 [Eleutherodactylus coqui]|uniref:Uncharacterized protein n=1 Tax=Eleutherodactylus coqui TaxID=57060 RepID=A0A8J6B3S1_ELECQ|nr:hypothetical protein GDO78_021455 [Eleutherodactylus coqui]